MNKYLLTLVISVLCLVFFIFFGYQRLSNVVISNILHRLNTGSVQFSFREVRYRFPFSLEIRDIQVENQGSILQSPLALITLDWNFIFGRKASLRIDLPQAQLYSDPTDFFQKMKAFRIEKVPDFTLSIHKLDFSQSLLLNRSFQVDLTKNQETLLFAIRSSQIEVSGTIEDSQRLRAHFQMISGYSSGAGNIQWNYQDNLVSGSFESPVPFSFSAELFPQKNGELELHHIEVKSPGASPFSFIGEGSFQMGNDPFCQMKGTIREEKKGRNFQMEASFRPLTQPVEGTFRLQSKDPDFSFHTSFRLNPNDSTFTLTVLPGSTAYRCPVEGGVKGSYQGGKVMVDVKTPPLNLQFPELLPEFVGKGSFAGHFSYEKKQLSGEGTFLGETVSYQAMVFQKPMISFRYVDGKGLFFEFTGMVFDGEASLKGSYIEKKLEATGTLTASKIESLIPGKIPLQGVISGTFHLSRNQDHPPAFSLDLNAGELSWKDMFIGTIHHGHIQYQKKGLSVTDLVIQQKEGEIQGTIEMNESDISGKMKLVHYPFSYRLGDREVEFVLEGDGQFQSKKGKWEASVNIGSPTWTMGEFSGRNMLFHGTFSDQKVHIQELTAPLYDGLLSIKGTVSPYQDIDLSGIITQVTIPENKYGYAGTLNTIAFSIRGPWKGTHFTFDGNGDNLVLHEKPFGDSFSLRFAGDTGLPERNETPEITKYINPEILKEGTLIIKGVRLSQLGWDTTNRNQISGSADLIAKLDPRKKVWSFHTENLEISVAKMFHLTGIIRGSYHQDLVQLDEMSLADTRKTVVLDGSGSFDIPRRSPQLKLHGSVETRLPLLEYGVEVYLRGSMDWEIKGPLDAIDCTGMVALEKGVFFQDGKEVGSISNLQGVVQKNKLHIQAAKGQLMGLDFTANGDITTENVALVFDVDGGKNFLPAIKAFQGNWRGKIHLDGPFRNLQAQGEVKVFGGFLDTTVLEPSQKSSDIIRNIEESFKRIPVKINISLLTGDSFRVKTRFLGLALTGGVVVTTEKGPLQMEGRLDVTRGVYDLVMKTIPLKGYVIFGELFGFTPQIFLEGNTRVDRYHITLKAAGPLDDYEMTLVSEPQLSREEILSLLFIGDKDAYQTLDTLQLEPHLFKALRFLLGKNENLFPKNPFFDSLELITPGQDGNGFYGLELQKDLGENASISYTLDLSGGDHSSLNLEADLSKEWSFKSEFGENGKYGWELEFRTRF